MVGEDLWMVGEGLWMMGESLWRVGESLWRVGEGLKDLHDRSVCCPPIWGMIKVEYNPHRTTTIEPCKLTIWSNSYRLRCRKVQE